MRTINNPVTHSGKVTCLHYYELCTGKWYVHFIGIFTFRSHVWLYHVENCKNATCTLIDFGDDCPSNMEAALNKFISLIY